MQLFLDDPNTTVLCVRALRGGALRLGNSLGFLEGGESEGMIKNGGGDGGGAQVCVFEHWAFATDAVSIIIINGGGSQLVEIEDVSRL